MNAGGKAQFLILHGDGDWEAEFIDLSYDTEAAIRELHESGLDRFAPCWSRVTQQVLLGGSVSHGMALERVMELCREKTGECNWPDIPEKYWEAALEELGI